MATVNAGQDRKANPISTGITLYHGFKAGNIIVNDVQPPPFNIISCESSINLKANPIPSLMFQDRIIYHWECIPPEMGVFNNNDNAQSEEISFTTNTTGDAQIRYYIQDIATGYTCGFSLPLTVHSASIAIVPPLDDRFTFNEASPGILEGDFHAAIEPPSIRELVTWTFDPIGNSILTIIPDLPNGNVHFKYEDLPTGNDFGSKTVRVSSPNPAVSDFIQIRAYFLKNIDNHPSSPGYEPNWYYYWTRTNAATGPSMFGGLDCIPQATGYFYWNGYDWAETYYHLCIKAGFNVTFNGHLYDGIDCFGTSSLHENEHYDNWWSSWCDTCGFNPTIDDPDTDYIPSIRETNIYHTDPNNSHTFGMWDQEYIGYWANLKWVIGSKNSEDWANPGHQY